MKAAILLLALLPLLPAAPSPATARFSLRLPDTSHELEISWRQIGTDLQRWVEPQGLSEQGRHMLRVQTLLALGGELRADVDVRLGEHRLHNGSYPFSFTVDQGGVLRFFVVNGNDAHDLESEALEPGWEAPHMTMQLVLAASDEVHLVWHLGARAGRIVLRLGLGQR